MSGDWSGEGRCTVRDGLGMSLQGRWALRHTAEVNMHGTSRRKNRASQDASQSEWRAC